MDFASAYCPTRREIEEHGWALSTRLFSLTGKLLKVIGRDHHAFVTLRQECHTTRHAIAQSNQSLRDHRREHGC
jgi:hypothetical protein